eukprot:2220338-Rhodomonas_salina.1
MCSSLRSCICWPLAFTSPSCTSGCWKIVKRISIDGTCMRSDKMGFRWIRPLLLCQKPVGTWTLHAAALPTARATAENDSEQNHISDHTGRI